MTSLGRCARVSIDPATNTFGSYTADGAVRTFFKPSSDTYWARQKGVLIR